MSAAKLPTWALLAVAACAGAATMVVELSAVRLLAPWFGTSQAVWTNVIGVVLLALAAGYLLGARLSAGPRPARALGIVLALAAAGAGVLPFAAAGVARTFLPQGLALDEVAGLLRWGSLATALCLFLPPALLLGCVSPLCAEVLDRGLPRGAGASGGRVLCVSTLGSLAGTFATSYVLLPSCGLTRSFVCASLLLALLAAGVLAWTRAPLASALSLLPLALLAAGEGARPAPAGDAQVLAAAESPYQSVRVVRYGPEGASERRHLQVNEAFDSFQSVWRPEPGPIGDGSYYDVFALPPWWAGASGPWSVCVLGLGAGTTWRVLDGCLPPGAQLETLGVEIDPVVVELGRRWMGLEDGPARRILAGWDARVALAHCERRFDQIVVDAYANQIEIPAHLCTREFFALARERLVRGGFLCVNVGAFGLEDPVLEGVAAALCAGFDSPALALRVPFSRNVVLLARREAPLPDPGSAGWIPAASALDGLARRLAAPRAQRVFQPGTPGAPTDDRCDVERRQLESLARAHEALSGAGGDDASPPPLNREAARAEVEALYAAGDLPAALRTGLRALDRAPDDAALAWRVSELAESLRLAGPARRAVSALQLALERGAIAAADRAAWEAGLARHAAAARELEALEERSVTALLRARLLGGAGLGLCVLALGLLALRTPSPVEQ